MNESRVKQLVQDHDARGLAEMLVAEELDRERLDARFKLKENEVLHLRGHLERAHDALRLEIEHRDCPAGCGVLGKPLCPAHAALEDEETAHGT